MDSKFRNRENKIKLESVSDLANEVEDLSVRDDLSKSEAAILITKYTVLQYAIELQEVNKQLEKHRWKSIEKDGLPEENKKVIIDIGEAVYMAHSKGVKDKPEDIVFIVNFTYIIKKEEVKNWMLMPETPDYKEIETPEEKNDVK